VRNKNDPSDKGNNIEDDERGYSEEIIDEDADERSKTKPRPTTNKYQIVKNNIIDFHELLF